MSRLLTIIASVLYIAALYLLLRDNSWHIGIVPIILYAVSTIIAQIGGGLIQKDIETTAERKMNKIGSEIEARLAELTTETRLLRLEVNSLRNQQLNQE